MRFMRVKLSSTKALISCVTAFLIVCSTFSLADTEYYRHVVFDNSLTPDIYFYSSAMANGASFIEQTD